MIAPARGIGIDTLARTQIDITARDEVESLDVPIFEPLIVRFPDPLVLHAPNTSPYELVERKTPEASCAIRHRTAGIPKGRSLP